MDLQELQITKRTVRRDPEISDGAARLFAEIADMHVLDGGCFAGDTKLGSWVGCSSRTIRRRRHELEAAGYLQEKHENGRRYLIPASGLDKNDRTDLTDKTGQVDTSDGQNWPEVDKTDRTKLANTESIYTPTGEGAPARAREDPDQGTDYTDPVTAYREITGHKPHWHFAELIQHKVGTAPEHVSLWSAVCAVWSDTDRWNERQVKKMLDDYSKQLKQQHKQKQNGQPKEDLHRIRYN